MKLNDLKPAPGAKKNRRRVGRGLGSGRGKTAGRGQKGQSSRSGFSQGSGWEGGRSRLVMRLPKRGFIHHNTDYQIVNLGDLNRFEAGSLINAESLRAYGVVRHLNRPVKLLGNGELSVQNLTVELDAYSRSAVQALQNAGGTVRGDVTPESLASENPTLEQGTSAPKAPENVTAPDETPADSTQTQAEEQN